MAAKVKHGAVAFDYARSPVYVKIIRVKRFFLLFGIDLLFVMCYNLT